MENTKSGLWERATKVFDVWEKLRSLLEQLGLKAVILNTIAWAALAFFAWFLENISWYYAVALGMFCLSAGLFAFHRVQLIRATSKFDARRYRDFGGNLATLAQEIFRFLADRARDRAEVHRTRQNEPSDASAHFSRWQADRDFDHVTGRLFFEKFGPQVLGSLALLRKLGVALPVHGIAMASSRPEGLPQFLGAIGHLLSSGHIKEAIDISHDRDFMWQIGH